MNNTDFIDECRNIAFNVRTCWLTDEYLNHNKLNIKALIKQLNVLANQVEELPEKYNINNNKNGLNN